VQRSGGFRRPGDVVPGGEHKTAKLKGIPLHHFAAFLNVASRENDYVWGRLDGAEMILRTLQEVHASKAAPNAGAPQANTPHLA
jgi:hypothetical protein